MRRCWVVWLTLSGCFQPDDSDHTPPPPLSVVQTFVAPPVAVTAGQLVTVPIPPTTEGDELAIVLASTSSLDEPVSVQVGDNRVRVWLRGIAPECTADVETAFAFQPTHAASTISFYAAGNVTVEIGLLELTPQSGDADLSTGPWYGDTETFQQIGPATAPQIAVAPNGLVFSTIASCSPVQLLSANFVSLGLTTPGADAAFALPTQAQQMGARWFYEGSSSYITKTFAFDP